MLSFRMGTKSSLRLNWPKSDSEIIALAVQYVARESALPPAEQMPVPPLAMMQDLLARAQIAQADAYSGESQRAKGSERYKQAMAQAMQQLRLAQAQLQARHFANLAELEDWGFNTVVGANGTVVRLPHKQTEWHNLLKRYVAYESTLPVEDQLVTPSLAEMTALRDTLDSTYDQRIGGRNKRMTNNEIRSVAAEELYDLLQMAAVVQVVMRFERKLSVGLRDWGFDITAVTPADQSEPPEEEQPAGAAMSLETAPAMAASNGAALQTPA